MLQNVFDEYIITERVNKIINSYGYSDKIDLVKVYVNKYTCDPFSHAVVIRIGSKDQFINECLDNIDIENISNLDSMLKYLVRDALIKLGLYSFDRKNILRKMPMNKQCRYRLLKGE